MVNGCVMIEIIYEDNHLLVVVKPVNIPIQADSSKDKDLLTILKDDLKQRYHKPGNVYLGLVHRLDRPVGGVCVFAKTSKAASRLAEQVRTHQFQKVYYAVINQENFKPEGTLTDYLVKNHRLNQVTTCKKDVPNSKYACLDYQILAVEQHLSLVKINLKTGRSHQIRVQFASRNAALWGDQRYNKQAKVKQQIALWATELSIFHPITKEKLTFTSNPPKTNPWNLFFK